MTVAFGAKVRATLTSPTVGDTVIKVGAKVRATLAAPNNTSTIAVGAKVRATLTVSTFYPGETIFVPVLPPNGALASISLTGRTPAPALSGTGNSRSFTAPIFSVDTTLTFTVTDSAGATAVTLVRVSAAKDRVFWDGSWQPAYEVASVVDAQFNLSGLVMRYRADDITGTDGSQVAAWPSAIVGGPDAVQATSANQPILRTNSLNGHRAVDFDGVTQRMSLAGAVLNAARNKTNLIISAAYRVVGTVTGTRTLFGLSNNSTVSRVALYQNVTGINVHQAGGRRLDADAFGTLAASIGTVPGNTEILTVEFQYANSDLYLYKNGVLIASSTTFQTSGASSDTASLSGFLGCNGPGTGEFFDGLLGEVIVKDVADPTGSVKADINAYLAATYGVTLGVTGNLANPAMPTTQTVSGFETTWGWVQDFNTNVAEGGFTNVTTGSDLGLLNPASAGGAAYSTGAGAFKTKAANSVTGESPGTVYSAVDTTSVSAGSLWIREHFVGGIPKGGAFKPLFPGANPNFRAYGRYLYAIKFWPSTSAGWGGVVDLIGNGTDWAAGGGEYGVPENGYQTGTLGAFIRDSDHVADPNRAGHVVRRNAVTYGYPGGLNDMCVWEIRSQPGRMRIIMYPPGNNGASGTGGYVLWDDTTNPPTGTDLMGFLFQSGAGSMPTAGSEATAEIAWCLIAAWDASVSAITHGSQITASNTGHTAYLDSGLGRNVVDGDLIVHNTEVYLSDLAANGATITKHWFKGGLVIDRSNVTFTACRFDHGLSGYWSGTHYPFTLNWCTVQGSPNPIGYGSVYYQDYTVYRCYIACEMDGLKANGGVTATECFIRCLTASPDDHNDGVQSTGSYAGNLIQRCNIDARPLNGSGGGSGGPNAALFVADASSGLHVWTDNFVAGGGYVIRCYENSTYNVQGNWVLDSSWIFGPTARAVIPQSNITWGTVRPNLVVAANLSQVAVLPVP